MKQTKTAQVVTENVELEFVDPQGEATSIDADLVFDPADPYAITMVFRTGVQEVLWTFGRELLVEGRYEPTGDGDVHVWPCLSSDGGAVVIIELCSPDGELLVQANSRNVDSLRDGDAGLGPGRPGERVRRLRRRARRDAQRLTRSTPHGSGCSASRVDQSSISSRVTGPGATRSRSSSRCTPCTSRVVDNRKISSAESSTSIGSSISLTSYHSSSRALVTPARQPAPSVGVRDLSLDDVADVGAGALAEVSGQVLEDRLTRAVLCCLGQGDHVLGVRRGLHAGHRSALVAWPGHRAPPRSSALAGPSAPRPPPSSARRRPCPIRAGTARRCR